MFTNYFYALLLLGLLNQAHSSEKIKDQEAPKGVAVVVGCTGEGGSLKGLIANAFFNVSLTSSSSSKAISLLFGDHDHSKSFEGRKTYTIDILPAKAKTKCTHIQKSWFEFKPAEHFSEPIDILYFENFPPVMTTIDEQPTDNPALVQAIVYGTPLLAPGGKLFVDVITDVWFFENPDVQEIEGTSPFLGIYTFDLNTWHKAYTKEKEYKRLGAAMDLLAKEVHGFAKTAEQFFGLQKSVTREDFSCIPIRDFMYSIALLATILDKAKKMERFVKGLGYENVTMKGIRDNPYNKRRLIYLLEGTKPLSSIEKPLAAAETKEISKEEFPQETRQPVQATKSDA